MAISYTFNPFTGNFDALSLVTIGTANGLSITSDQVLSLTLANTSTTGALSSTDWNTFNNKQPAGNYITALTGDATASGPGSAALTLVTVNSNVGTFGSASSVAAFTVNAKGLTTAASNISIQIAEAQVTNLVADLAAKQPTGNYITALTGDVTASGPGSAVATIGANKVTLGMQAQLAANTVIGNITGSLATPTAVAVSQVTSANTIVQRNASKNIAANNVISDFTSTPTAAGTTALTAGSTYQQFFTGTTTQIVTLVDTSFITTGHTYFIVNNSTGNVTVNSSAGNLIQVMAPGTELEVTCVNVSINTAAAWQAFYGFSNAVNNLVDENFVGTGSQTIFTLGAAPGSVANTWVSVGGVVQDSASYTVAGTTLTFSTAPPSGVKITVKYGATQTVVALTSNFTSQNFTGDGTTVAFTLSSAPGSASNTFAFIGSVKQRTSTYTVVGAVVTFSAAPANGVPIEIQYGSSTTIGTPGSGTVTNASFASAPALTVKGNNTAGIGPVTDLTATQVRSLIGLAPKITTYASSGSGTHTLTGSPLYIRVRMVGAGGGGGGSGTAAGTTGGTGTASVFGTISMGGADGGQAVAGGSGGIGGVPSNPSGYAGIAINGARGSGNAVNRGSSTDDIPGPAGASSFFGGGGPSAQAGGGTPAQALAPGSGGAGASVLVATGFSGGAGGAGAFCDLIIPNPAASYSYVVGLRGIGGGGGTSGLAGGTAADGLIEITEYYQ